MIWTEYFDLMCKMNGEEKDGKEKEMEKKKQLI
jgi:hypothetical protein